MKIDIIIPVFKIDGLRESLMSINRSVLANIIIVDDGQFNDYSDILKEFKTFFEIKIIQLEKNVGQGLARQSGVNASYNEIIMFLDCGDMLYSPALLSEMAKLFSSNRNLIATEHRCFVMKNNNLAKQNYFLCINGQFYRRSIAEKYNVEFCPQNMASRNYEDLAWRNQFANIAMLFHYDIYNGTNREPSIIKIYNKNSISAIENGRYDYEYRTIGSAYNVAFALEKMFTYTNDVNRQILNARFYSYLCAIFCIHIKTIKEAPKYIKNSEKGLDYAIRYFLKNKIFINKNILREHFHSQYIKEINNNEEETYFEEFLNLIFRYDCLS